MPEKLYRASDLYKALARAGIVSRQYARAWVLIQERRNRIIYPKTPYEHRRYTKDQIKEIVQAFSPGGEKFWRLKSNS